MPYAADIKHTGLYYALITTCSDSPFVVNGLAEWRNRYGYLPGELVGLLGFETFMTVLYVFTAALWAFASWRHQEHFINLGLLLPELLQGMPGDDVIT